MSPDFEENFSPDEPELLEARLDSISVTNVGFILFLKVNEDARVLPIFIGANEAQSIALALNEEASPRPLTHDLMKAMLEALEASVQRVEIRDIREGTFYGRVYLERAGFEEMDFDARPSDAIALALRAEAPIYVGRKVFEEAAVPVASVTREEGEGADAVESEDQDTEGSRVAEARVEGSPDSEGGPASQTAASPDSSSEESPTERAPTPAEQLHGALEKAIREERYEEAARLRDAIRKLHQGN